MAERATYDLFILEEGKKRYRRVDKSRKGFPKIIAKVLFRNQLTLWNAVSREKYKVDRIR